MTARIIDRGRGPELKGTRITVYCIMDYLRAGDPPARIAEELAASRELLDRERARVSRLGKNIENRRAASVRDVLLD